METQEAKTSIKVGAFVVGSIVIALGSLFELQTQIEIAFNLNYISEITFQTLFDQSREIERMLSSLISKLKK